MPHLFPIDRYLNVRAAGAPSFSPDGQQIAYLTNTTGIPACAICSAKPGVSRATLARNSSIILAGSIFRSASIAWSGSDRSRNKALTDVLRSVRILPATRGILQYRAFYGKPPVFSVDSPHTPCQSR